MIRRTIGFTNALNQRLKILAKDEEKNFSAVVRELLAKALAMERKAQIKRMYQAFENLEGLGPRGITDASTTINETLYGEHGAWRGNDERRV